MKYFKPDYIRDFEAKNGILSFLEVLVNASTFVNFLREKKLKIVNEKIKMNHEDKLMNLETIFETKQNFLIHYNSELSDCLGIYYKPEQHNELIIFIKQLKKQFKDGTIDN